MQTIDMFHNATDFQVFAAGQIVFREDEPGDMMYAVKAGEVEITANGKTIERIGPGSLFGEMAIIEHLPRSATAIAVTECQLVPINQKRFLFLVQQTPYFALQVMKTMSARLRRKLDLETA